MALLTRTIRQWITADQIRFIILVVPAFILSLKALAVPAKPAAS